MRDFFFVVLIAASQCLANSRYGLMSGQMPLGDESVNLTSITPQECGELCGARSSPGLLYRTGTSTCTCYSRVLGFADVVDSSEVGYIQVDDASATCLSVTQHQAIIVSMVYGASVCPPGFGGSVGSSYCDSATYGNMTEAECEKYGAFVLAYDTSYDPPHCQLFTNDTVV